MVATTTSSDCVGPRSAACLKRAGPLAVPEAVAWLDHLSLDMQTASKSGKAEYLLTLRYAPVEAKLAAPTTWTVSRSFDEYRAFQKRLLKRMRHGHVCGAECKWLYKVVKHYFPKSSLFCNNCPKVVESRQQTLIRYMSTVQASLVNRGNHGCAVLVHDVAGEFNRFVVRSMTDLDASSAATQSSSSELSNVTRDSLDSLDSASESESESDSDDDDDTVRPVEEADCDACHSRHVVCRAHSGLR